MKKDSDTRLVYSSDPALNKKCSKCKELISECHCRVEVVQANSKFVAYLRLEKAGRAGKTVTVIRELPRVDSFLKALTSELKSKCGSGGTYRIEPKEGVVEIQGDKKEAIRNILVQKGIKTKG